MEVEVKRIASSDVGFVALPLQLIYALQQTILPPLLVLELTSRDHARWFVAWSGNTSKSACIEVPEALAACMDLPDGTLVTVRARIDIPEAISVQVEPSTADDCEVLELNASYLEDHVLTKVGVVQAGSRFPVAVPGQGTVFLLAKATSPGTVVKLVSGTELHVSMKRRPLKRTEAVENQRDVWLRVQGCDEVFRLDDGNVTVIPTTSVWISSSTARRVDLENGQMVLLRHKVLATMVDDTPGKKELTAKAALRRTLPVRLVISDLVSEGHLMISEPLRRYVGVRLHAGILVQPIRETRNWHPTVIRLNPILQEEPVQGSNHGELTPDASRVVKIVRAWIETELRATSGSQEEVVAGENAMVTIVDAQEFNFLVTFESKERPVDQPGYYSISKALLDAGNGNSPSLEVQLGRPQYFQLLPKENQPKLPSLDSVWPNGVAADALDRLKVLLSPETRRKIRILQVPLPGGALVHGPRACGKTQLALALANEVNKDRKILAHWIYLKCAELSGEAEKSPKRVLREAALEAVEHAPSLVVLDDVDALFPSAEGRETAATSLGEYLSDLVDEAQETAPVAFCATAGDPKALPFAGRFDCVVELQQPKATERAEILKVALKGRKLVCSDSLAIDFAEKCEGYDANDLEIIVDRAMHAAASRLLNNKRKNGGNHGLLPEDFEAALEGYTPASLKGIAKGAAELKLGWSDIGGLSEVRRVLQELLELPVKFPKLFANAPLRLRTGVLLYGPPGCGKTHTVAAAAAACNLRFVPVKGPELLDKYIGASEKAVRDVFVKAAAAAPCILFFDEFDAIAPKRGHDNTGVTDRVVNQLLAELDGVSTLNGVFVFAATNRPDLIDAALLRPGRLDHLLFCNFPSTNDRLDILRVLSRHLPMAEDIDLEYVARRTEGFSGADLKAVLSDAELEAVHLAIERSETPIITMEVVKAALGKTVPLQEAERRRFAGIYSSFSGGRSSSKDAKGKKATLA